MIDDDHRFNILSLNVNLIFSSNPSLIFVLGLPPLLHEPHPGTPDHPSRCRGGNVRYTDIRLPILLCTLCEDQTRAGLTPA